MSKCQCGLEKEIKFLFTSSYEECLRCDILVNTKTEANEHPRNKVKFINRFDGDFYKCAPSSNDEILPIYTLDVGVDWAKRCDEMRVVIYDSLTAMCTGLSPNNVQYSGLKAQLDHADKTKKADCIDDLLSDTFKYLTASLNNKGNG